MEAYTSTQLTTQEAEEVRQAEALLKPADQSAQELTRLFQSGDNAALAAFPAKDVAALKAILRTLGARAPADRAGRAATRAKTRRRAG